MGEFFGLIGVCPRFLGVKIFFEIICLNVFNDDFGDFYTIGSILISLIIKIERFFWMCLKF